VRGGADERPKGQQQNRGPSPRARGSLLSMTFVDMDNGSIPACAGEPLEAPNSGHPSRVHPRVRGGATGISSIGMRLKGPSPRARGSLTGGHRAILLCGSIPACAGEPFGRRLDRDRCGVHPRVRGGAIMTKAVLIPDEGPSPRARGSHRDRPFKDQSQRSIPACAGEPWTSACR